MNYWGQVCIRVESMWQTRGVWRHALQGNFNIGPFITRNLVETATISART